MCLPFSTPLTPIRRSCSHTLLSTMFKACAFLLMQKRNNGALGTLPKGLEKYLQNAGTTISVELLQKTAVSGTAQILGR